MSEHCTCATSDYCQVHDEIGRLRSLLADAQVAYVARGMELRDAEARLAEAERDAARYRWLRERINWRDQFVRSEDGRGLSTRWRAWVHDDYRESPPASEHIDEYIDAAMEGGE